jgi:hypothetical protein
LLEAVLQDCEPGEQLHIAFDRSLGHAILTLSREPARASFHGLPALERLSILAGQVGATITPAERILVSIPLRPSEVPSSVERARPVSRDADELREGQQRHDVRGARESHHGQSGTH